MFGSRQLLLLGSCHQTAHSPQWTTTCLFGPQSRHCRIAVKSPQRRLPPLVHFEVLGLQGPTDLASVRRVRRQEFLILR